MDGKLSNRLWLSLRMVTSFSTALCDDFTNTLPGCSELNRKCWYFLIPGTFVVPSSKYVPSYTCGLLCYHPELLRAEVHSLLMTLTLPQRCHPSSQHMFSCIGTSSAQSKCLGRTWYAPQSERKELSVCGGQ